jgi:hypothetical protein
LIQFDTVSYAGGKMSIRDLFKQNPFQNLIVAGQSTADFPLRGHEDLLEQRLREIGEAIENPDYPANAQHTIVFGEWGYGKTHVLRTIEYKINTSFSHRAKAVFFEPTESDPQGIFQELCQKLEITAGDPSEFIENIQNFFPESLFLLIDETQALVGEKLSEDYEGHLRKYWQLLSDLQKAAIDKLYSLHVFHGLSANSASAIKRVGQIPAIQQFKRHIFSLKSLDEEAQWQMFSDHVKKALKDKEIQIDALINRGVSRCIIALTGGNPRFALSLMDKLYFRAQSKGLDKIDGSICYQTLCEVQRFDASGQNYFDRFSIKEVLEQLKAGQQFEKKIAEMLQQQVGYLLGEWGGIDQAGLAQYDLTTANIRRRCKSLEEPVILFDQPPGQTYFRLSNDFLRLIQLRVQKTLTEVDDKDLLLSLQLEPESLSPSMMIGIREVMAHNGFHGQLRPLQTATPFRIYITDIGGNHFAQYIKVGMAVFKGNQIPEDVFEKFISEIEADRCTIIIIIEDAITRHDFPGSSYEVFKDTYNGDIDLEKRFIFINGTDSHGQQFEEDFFVRLVKTDIQEDEAKDWFDRLQINRRLKQVEEDCIYCPDLNEQTLLEELFKQDRSFKIGEIRSMNANFDWVRGERLKQLELYLKKTGLSYTPPVIEEVGPFKFILGKLHGTEIGLTTSEIEGQIAAKYIRTGSPPAIQAYVKWVLNLLVNQNKLGKEDEKFTFRDLDRELMQIEDKYTKTLQHVEKEISLYDTAQIEEIALDEIRNAINNICQRIVAIKIDGTTEIKIAEHQDALNKLKELTNQLDEIPEKARMTLRNQLSETEDKFETIMQSASWPIRESTDPYESLYRLGEIKELLEELENRIKLEIPQQKRCRQEINSINKRLDVLGDLLEGEIESGTYEGQEIGRCIFNIINAIRDGKSGKITLHFS